MSTEFPKCPKEANFISFYSTDGPDEIEKTHLFSIVSDKQLNTILDNQTLKNSTTAETPVTSYNGFIIRRDENIIKISFFEEYLTIGYGENQQKYDMNKVREWFEPFKSYF